jgi:hypothetical protein
MINPFTVRRALREHSLTLALVVFLAVLGVSIWGRLYDGLRAVHVPWLLAAVLPFLLVPLLARHEQRLVKDPVLRRRLSVGLLLAALAAFLLL